MKNFFLTLSGIVYAVIASVHLIRLMNKWPVTIAKYAVPNRISLWACFIFMILSLGCFAARGQK